MRLSRFPLILSIAVFLANPLFSQVIKEEIDVGFSSLDSVRPILKRTLSSSGRFVLLPAKGSVLVIDDVRFVEAAKAALSGGALPDPVVNLQFAFRTGLPARHTKIQMGQEIMFPTAWDPPQIPNRAIIIGGGPIPITPAHPTNFAKRFIGVTSETVSTVNSDGSITMDINFENSRLEGFVNYGSAILPAGQATSVPVNGGVSNPFFFQPLIPNNIAVPIIGTTRISTSVLIRPRVEKGVVNIDMIPRFTVFNQEQTKEGTDINLKRFGTTVRVANNGVGRVYGFLNASEDFNRNFLGATDPSSGATAIEVRATVAAGQPAPPQSPNAY